MKTRKQKGGGWSFSGPAFLPVSPMVPEMARNSMNDCAVLERTALVQSGGCGCMKQNGGGVSMGGYGFTLNNQLGKTYDSVQPYGCSQIGGNTTDTVSYGTGYGYTAPRVVNGIYYTDPVPYGRSCMGGSRKAKTKRQAKAKRQAKRQTKHHH